MPEKALPDARVRVVIETTGQKDKVKPGTPGTPEAKAKPKAKPKPGFRIPGIPESGVPVPGSGMKIPGRYDPATTVTRVAAAQAPTLTTTAMRFGAAGLIVAVVLGLFKAGGPLMRMVREATGDDPIGISKAVQEVLDTVGERIDALESLITPAFTAAQQAGMMARAHLLLSGDPSVVTDFPEQFAVLYEIARKYKRISLEKERLTRNVEWGHVGSVINQGIKEALDMGQ